MLLNLGIVGQAVLLFVQGQIGRTGQPEQRICIALPFESQQQDQARIGQALASVLNVCELEVCVVARGFQQAQCRNKARRVNVDLDK